MSTTHSAADYTVDIVDIDKESDHDIPCAQTTFQSAATYNEDNEKDDENTESREDDEETPSQFIKEMRERMVKLRSKRRGVQIKTRRTIKSCKREWRNATCRETEMTG